jgi:hypothetical protein
MCAAEIQSTLCRVRVNRVVQAAQRFCPMSASLKSGQQGDVAAGPLCANSGREQVQQNPDRLVAEREQRSGNSKNGQ